MKKALHTLTYTLGIDRLFAHANRHRPVVLAFHGVTREPPGRIYNHEGKHLYQPIFERLAAHLAGRYHPVPLPRVVDWLEGKADLPPRAVAVTFDDGYRNVLTCAGPVLRAHGIPATVYVVSDFVFAGRMLWTDRLVAALGMTERPSITVDAPSGPLHLPLADAAERIAADRRIRALCKSLADEARVALLDDVHDRLGVGDDAVAAAWEDHQPLRPEELRALPELGIDVGSHTASHAILSRCAPPAIDRELQESKRAIEAACGCPCAHFGYPNGAPGDFDQTTRERVIAAGYRSATTTVKERVARGSDRYTIPRYILTHNAVTVSELSAELSGYPTLLRTLRRRAGQ
jgi:peptidoglycan/xylan/chitin deacetylase (PgdA/CDA1 family)